MIDTNIPAGRQPDDVYRSTIVEAFDAMHDPREVALDLADTVARAELCREHDDVEGQVIALFELIAAAQHELADEGGTNLAGADARRLEALAQVIEHIESKRDTPERLKLGPALDRLAYVRTQKDPDGIRHALLNVAAAAFVLIVRVRVAIADEQGAQP